MKNNVSFDSTLSKFGIGLFETIKIKNKSPIDIDKHLERLYNSIDKLNINFGIDKNEIYKLINLYIEDKNILNSALRVTIFDEGYNFSIRDIPYTKKHYEIGFKVTVSPIKRGLSEIYRHKTTNYFENIYSKNYALQKGFDEGLFIDLNGYILECSMSNIFFIKENKLYTPKKESSILNGIMRTRVIDICKTLDIICIEDDINIGDLDKFHFCFITNSLMELMKVHCIDNIIYENTNAIFENILNNI
jgi:4-amino-4-deoxychorismate lyase